MRDILRFVCRPYLFVRVAFVLIFHLCRLPFRIVELESHFVGGLGKQCKMIDVSSCYCQVMADILRKGLMHVGLTSLLVCPLKSS